MDFIERWFHVDPDAGSGVLEVLIIVAAVTCVVAVVWITARSEWRKR